jgi:hypothetical protein
MPKPFPYANTGTAAWAIFRATWSGVPVSLEHMTLEHLTRGHAFTRAAREGTSAGFRRIRVSVRARISLSASADLLSSVLAVDWLACWD